MLEIVATAWRRGRRWCPALLLVLLGPGLLGPGPAGAGTLQISVRDDKGQPVADAVAYVAGSGGERRSPAPGGAVMDQQNKEFTPYVLGVEVGTAVTFPNRDQIRHHVYSFSPAKRFELPLYRGTPPPVIFDTPGPVVLGCNIHDWMVGHIFVAPTRHFALTAADGTARLSGLPAGPHTLLVWHPRMRIAPEKTAQQVTVDVVGEAKAVFVLRLKPEWRTPRREYDTSGG
jgi:plastocyanin